MKSRLLGAIAPILIAIPLIATSPGGDPVKGRQVYVQCQACHKLDSSGKSTVGPNLYGVLDRRAGELRGYPYSPAMAADKRKWTPAALEEYLSAPRKAIPGNRMPYGGLRNAEDRRNLIAYIGSVSR